MDAIERDRGERLGAPRLEAAGEVVRLEPQERPREDAPAARDDPPDDAPVDRAAARDVARPDHQVRLPVDDRRDERREHRGVVAEVGVHLDDDAGTAIERGAEPVEVRPPETLLGLAVEDADARVGLGQLVGQAAGAVRRVVVDDEQRRARQGAEDRFGDRADVLGFVIGGEDDPGAEPELRVGDGRPARRWR